MAAPSSCEYGEKTSRLFRGLRRNVSCEENTEDVHKQEKKIREIVIPIYDQPLGACCPYKGEFVQEKIIGHRVILYEDDHGALSTDTLFSTPQGTILAKPIYIAQDDVLAKETSIAQGDDQSKAVSSAKGDVLAETFAAAQNTTTSATPSLAMSAARGPGDIVVEAMHTRIAQVADIVRMASSDNKASGQESQVDMTPELKVLSDAMRRLRSEKTPDEPAEEPTSCHHLESQYTSTDSIKLQDPAIIDVGARVSSAERLQIHDPAILHACSSASNMLLEDPAILDLSTHVMKATDLIREDPAVISACTSTSDMLFQDSAILNLGSRATSTIDLKSQDPAFLQVCTSATHTLIQDPAIQEVRIWSRSSTDVLRVDPATLDRSKSFQGRSADNLNHQDLPILRNCQSDGVRLKDLPEADMRQSSFLVDICHQTKANEHQTRTIIAEDNTSLEYTMGSVNSSNDNMARDDMRENATTKEQKENLVDVLAIGNLAEDVASGNLFKHIVAATELAVKLETPAADLQDAGRSQKGEIIDATCQDEDDDDDFLYGLIGVFARGH